MSMNAARGLKYLTQDEAIKVDQKLFNEYRFSVDQLMELAGLSCAQVVAKAFPKRCSVLVLVGPGNNGGDGLVCARHLKLFGYSPSVLYPKASKSDLMQRLITQVSRMDIPQIDEEKINKADDIKEFSLIVDAFFGFSFQPPVREPFGRLIEIVRQANLPVLCVDIPSGWNVETGPPSDGKCIQPTVLVSLTAPKKCANFLKNAEHYLGGRFVPPSLADEFQLNLPEYPDAEGIIKL